jgi:hypothetical protein
MFVDVDKKMGWAILFANSDGHRGTVVMILKIVSPKTIAFLLNILLFLPKTLHRNIAF